MRSASLYKMSAVIAVGGKAQDGPGGGHYVQPTPS